MLFNNDPEPLYNRGSYYKGATAPQNIINITFHIESGMLDIKNAPSGDYSLRATSGKGISMNKANSISIKNEGPIPIGTYYLYPHEFSDPGIATDLYRNIVKRMDWGDWLVKLHPLPGTMTFNRDKFHLHCGTVPGSAGCIDIGGGILGNNITERVKKDILQSGQDKIKLNVVR